MGAEKPREIALEVLEERETRGPFVEQLIENALRKSEIKGEDRRFLQELVYGVVRWQLTLDWLIAQKSAKPQKPAVQNLLRLALYQMFWLDRVPGYAAVNESVEICKRRGLLPQAKFVNAVLRGYGREMEQARKAILEFKEKNLSLGYSHPEWLCSRWEQRWGRAQTIELLDWNNSPPPVYGRVNTLKTTSAELRELWTEERVEFLEARVPWAPAETIYRLAKHPSLAKMKSFQEGLFYIQDPSTLLSVQMLEARKGETILDLCSAPGGKSTYLAQVLQNDCRIMAQDLDPVRLKLVEENRRRLGAGCITTSAAEFAAGALFDRVLVDAPCSNTGVMRRRIELRWRITAEEVRRLAATQLELLRKAGERVRIGGSLIYSTCSLEPEENDSVVREFLGSGAAFELQEQRELTPVADRVDGAFCARLVRTA